MTAAMTSCLDFMLWSPLPVPLWIRHRAFNRQYIAEQKAKRKL